MAENGNVPATWYKYDWPLKENDQAPKPSQANYSTENCSWLQEMFGSILGKQPWELTLRYENNTPDDRTDDIDVSYSGANNWYAYSKKHKEKSVEQLRYEVAAKKSARLRLFENNSPAGIDYFQDVN